MTRNHPLLPVAMCQVHTEPWNCTGNLSRLLESLDEVGRKGARLAITPECVLHGYADACPDFNARLMAAAVTLEDKALQPIRAKASQSLCYTSRKAAKRRIFGNGVVSSTRRRIRRVGTGSKDTIR